MSKIVLLSRKGPEKRSYTKIDYNTENLKLTGCFKVARMKEQSAFLANTSAR